MMINNNILRLFAVFLFSSVCVLSQTTNELFISPAGGFKINLPKTFDSSKEVSDIFGGFDGNGIRYIWEKPAEYRYQVQYIKIETEKTTLTNLEKTKILESFKKGLIKGLKAEGFPFIEKSYSFNGNKGAELHFSVDDAKAIIRIFVVNKRIYYLGIISAIKENESQTVKILDSFNLLDKKSLIAAKIEEATPEPLPQEPVAEKVKTDAQDNNLKGKVKSVIENFQTTATSNSERYSEEYYNEKGNLLKEISYSEGYPDDVTVWGYVDGNRVTQSRFIEFDDDQRPPMRNTIFVTTISANNSEENPPRDYRYNLKYIYKYNNAGQIIENQIFENNGNLWRRDVFNYDNNRREVSNYGEDNEKWGQSIEILDNDGNVVEKYSIDENGKPDERTFFSYTLDSQGNWIIQKAYKNKKIKGKYIRKLEWINSRTITYYP